MSVENAKGASAEDSQITHISKAVADFHFSWEGHGIISVDIRYNEVSDLLSTRTNHSDSGVGTEITSSSTHPQLKIMTQ